MSSSVGNNIPLDRSRPRSSSAGRCGSRTRCSRSGTGSCSSATCPAGEPMEAKLALARAIVARSHGEEAAERGGGALHARRARGSGAGRGARRRRCRTGDPVHLPALLAAAFGLSTSEARRLIAQGGVKLDGERGHRARRAARASSSARLVQAGKRRFARLPRDRLTAPVVSATIPRPPERVGVAKSLSSTTGAPPSLDRIRSVPQAL